MPKYGVSYIDVENTANALIEKGENPSITNVLKILGTGSRTTINKYLTQWREAQPEMRTGLPEKLMQQVKVLLEQMREQANDAADKAVANAQNSIELLKVELNTIGAKNMQLAKGFESTTSQLEEEKFKVKTLDIEIQELKLLKASLTAQYETLKSQHQESQERAADYKMQLEQVQANLEHFRNAVAKQRVEEKAGYEREFRQLTQDLAYLKQQQVKEEQYISELKHKLDVLHEEKKADFHKYEQLKEDNIALKLTINTQENYISNINKNFETLSQDYEKALNMHHDQDKVNNALELENTKIKEKISILEPTLLKLEARLEQLQHEKLYFNQENIELKMQLKIFKTQKNIIS